MQVDGFGPLTKMGSGGLGDVYRATRLSTGGPVAIKVLRDWSDSSTSWHRAQRELRALVDLQGHPHVVHVEEAVEIDGVPLLIMEYAPGGSVGDLMQRQHHLSFPDVVLVGEQTASALAASHGLGIIHLDIKPHNLVIGAFGQVKVCDFGIAALTQTEQFKTRTSAVSFRYASPEQLNEDPSVGPPADVFSLGATLAHLATGTPLPVITGDTTRTKEPFALPGEDEQSAPAVVAFVALVNECLRVIPNARPTAAEALARFAQISEMLGDRRSRALPVVVDTSGETRVSTMVPRVITSPTAGAGLAGGAVNDGATVPRMRVQPPPPSPGQQPYAVPGTPLGYESGPIPPGYDPTVMNPARSVKYGYVTQPGTGHVQLVPVQAPKRSGAMIAAVAAALAAVVALAAVGIVVLGGGGNETPVNAGEPTAADESASVETREAPDSATDTTEEQAAATASVTTPPTEPTAVVAAVTTAPPPVETTSPVAPVITPAPAAPYIEWTEEQIGTASGGSPIMSYHAGTPGGIPVLVVGGLQPRMWTGGEVINELRRLRVPDGIEMWVVPRAVPDGSGRQNANTVDINRNFPVEWRVIPFGDNNYSGPGPASEPETVALIDLAARINPTLEINLLGPLDALIDATSDIQNPRLIQKFAEVSGIRMPIGEADCESCYGTMTQHMSTVHGDAFLVQVPESANFLVLANAVLETSRVLVTG